MFLTAFISPFRADRKMVRDLVEANEFIEIYMAIPVAICEQRDPKDLYKKARRGELKSFTGIDSEYEVPETAEITVNTAEMGIEDCADMVTKYLTANQIIHD